MKNYIILAAGVLMAIVIFAGIGVDRKGLPGRTPYLVNDYAGVVDDVTKRNLESLLIDMRDNNPMHTEVVVSTFKSLNGMTFDKFFTLYLRGWWRWPILEQHNRIQIVIIAGEGRMRIGVGTRIDKIVTTEMTNRIMQDLMLSEFKRGNYSLGIKSGVKAIIAILNKSVPAK